MAQPPPIYEIAELQAETELSSSARLFEAYREELVRCLASTGFAAVRTCNFEGTSERELVLSALAGGQPVLICLPLPAAEPMRILPLSETCCRSLPPEPDVFYASFFASPSDAKLYLLGPVLLRRGGMWLSHDVASAQFLPRKLRGDDLALSPLLGGASLFKTENLLIPYVLTRGEMPAFSVAGLFNEHAQADHGFQALFAGAPPTHFMLVHRGDDLRRFDFVRPVFFFGDAPDTELRLLHTGLLEDAPESGMVELCTAAGSHLNAECLEAILLPTELPIGRRYRWTLSLVTEDAAAAEQLVPLSQDPLTTFTTLSARVLECGNADADGTPVQHWTLRILPEEERVILHAFVGPEITADFSVEPGDMIVCRGYLHASPDAIIDEEVEPPVPHTAESPSLTEAAACRILCNAVCLYEWDEFIAASHPNLTYSSKLNGTQLPDRAAFIRYMGERRQLWRKQHGWSSMSWDTGTILCDDGVRRPCYMLACGGQKVGASVVTLRDGKISAIETLPQSANDSFECDEECRIPPRIFHPLRGHITTHSQEPSTLQIYAASYLRECMKLYAAYCPPNSTNFPSGAARWVKLVRCEPGYCDLAFALASHVFAVRAVEVPVHPDRGGNLNKIADAMPDRDAFISFAQQQALVPCIFPAQRDFSPEPRDSWNLWDARTLQSVRPEQLPTPDACPPPSAWEILLGCIAEFQNRISAEGGLLLAYHDVPNFFPHLWYRDASGNLCWVIFRCSVNPAQPDSTLSDAEQLPLRLAPNTSGFIVNATAFGNPPCTTPPRRGEPAYLKFSSPIRLD